MPTSEARQLLDRLELIWREGASFLEQSADYAVELNRFDYKKEEDYYWAQLPAESRTLALTITSKLIDFANDVSNAVRRSPLLGQADLAAAGHYIRGMRAALRLRSYVHWDPEVMHDEGTVLGVRPASFGEMAADPAEAKTEFDKEAARLAAILELVTAGIEDGKVAIGTSGLSAPAGYRPGTAFIVMSMQASHPELDDVCDTVKRCFSKFGIQALRADDIEHEDVITKKILDEIRTAEFLFADLSGERPSVYYEVGYAHALSRRVILYRKAGTVIHFDLAAYNCPEYKNLRDLETLLTKRLESVTGQTSPNTVSEHGDA